MIRWYLNFISYFFLSTIIFQLVQSSIEKFVLRLSCCCSCLVLSFFLNQRKIMIFIFIQLVCVWEDTYVSAISLGKWWHVTWVCFAEDLISWWFGRNVLKVLYFLWFFYEIWFHYLCVLRMYQSLNYVYSKEIYSIGSISYFKRPWI